MNPRGLKIRFKLFGGLFSVMLRFKAIQGCGTKTFVVVDHFDIDA